MCLALNSSSVFVSPLPPNLPLIPPSLQTFRSSSLLWTFLSPFFSCFHPVGEVGEEGAGSMQYGCDENWCCISNMHVVRASVCGRPRRPRLRAARRSERTQGGDRAECHSKLTRVGRRKGDGSSCAASSAIRNQSVIRDAAPSSSSHTLRPPIGQGPFLSLLTLSS
jgi:hypothetical protein